MLRRDTFEYRSLLATACHPDLLRDGLDQDRHLDRLWALPAWEDHALAYVDHERADLWRGDVPVFTIRPDSVDARSSTGVLIPGVTDRPALDLALAKADALGEPDLARQLQLLRLSVTTADGAREPRRHPVTSPPAPPGRPAEGPDLAARALAKAVDAGEQLLREAYRGSADLAWAGPNWAPPGRWAPAELGPDLYSGTAGVALFLHQLATVTGDREHRSTARAAELTLRHQIRRRADRLGGGLAGVGGILYALAHLAAHHPDAELDALAAQVVRRSAATAADDAQHDLLAGNAGTIGGLLAWAAVRPGPAVTDALAACAERLVRAAAPHPEGGAGWLPASSPAPSSARWPVSRTAAPASPGRSPVPAGISVTPGCPNSPSPPSSTKTPCSTRPPPTGATSARTTALTRPTTRPSGATAPRASRSPAPNSPNSSPKPASCSSPNATPP